jgi:hypothetical protein
MIRALASIIDGVSIVALTTAADALDFSTSRPESVAQVAGQVVDDQPCGLVDIGGRSLEQGTREETPNGGSGRARLRWPRSLAEADGSVREPRSSRQQHETLSV